MSEQGRRHGGMKSQAGRAAYWQMQHEASSGALADLIAENTENVEAVQSALASLERAAHDGATAIMVREVRGVIADLRRVFPADPPEVTR